MPLAPRGGRDRHLCPEIIEIYLSDFSLTFFKSGYLGGGHLRRGSSWCFVLFVFCFLFGFFFGFLWDFGFVGVFVWGVGQKQA